MSLLKIKILEESMVDSYKKHIENRNPMDAGFDLFIPDTHVIQKLKTSNAIDHKIQIEYHKNEIEKLGPQFARIEGLKNNPSHILMFPRSSISKTGLRLANAVGIIDSSYRGNLIAKVDNLGAEIEVKKGTSLFQLLVGEHCNVQIVSQLSETKRGESGFGSTGNTI